MKRVILKAIIDNETGVLGLICEGTPIINYPMVSTDGLIIAHDLLEHVNGVKAIGSIGDELLAMGACWYIRGQFGDISRNNENRSTPYESIASDLINMGSMVIEGNVPYRVPVPRTCKHDFDVDFHSIIEYAKSGLLDELGDSQASAINLYLKNCLHYLRKGFLLAKAKYKNALFINSIFWEIAEAVQNVINNELMYEGQRFLVRYSLSHRNKTSCINFDLYE